QDRIVVIRREHALLELFEWRQLLVLLVLVALVLFFVVIVVFVSDELVFFFAETFAQLGGKGGEAAEFLRDHNAGSNTCNGPDSQVNESLTGAGTFILLTEAREVAQPVAEVFLKG